MNLSLRYWVFLIPLAVLLLHGVTIYRSDQSGTYEYSRARNDGDAGHFLRIAENISRYGVYSDDYSGNPSESATWRPPVWPLILAFFRTITGEIFWIVLLKKLLELTIFGLGAFFLWRFEFMSSTSALALSAILVEPQYLKYSSTLLTESLSAVLMFLFCVLVLIGFKVPKYQFIAAAVGVIAILLHPVTIVFICLAFLLLLWKSLKSSRIHAVLLFSFFALLIMIWPIRNHLTFQQGIFLTSSQGINFSKAWNEKVAETFNNTNYDVFADERLNFKFVAPEKIEEADGSVIKESKLFTFSTMKFMSLASYQQLGSIAAVKLKSNFNPFPERPKAGLIELLATLSRSLALLVLLATSVVFLTRLGYEKSSLADWFVFAPIVIIGQATMAIVFLTSLRYNAVYSLILATGVVIVTVRGVGVAKHYFNRSVATEGVA